MPRRHITVATALLTGAVLLLTAGPASADTHSGSVNCNGSGRSASLTTASTGYTTHSWTDMDNGSQTVYTFKYGGTANRSSWHTHSSWTAYSSSVLTNYTGSCA